MVIKLYEKLDNQWYFSRFGKEYWLGFQISKVLSFFSVCKKRKILYIECISDRDTSSPCLGWFHITENDVLVSSNIFPLFNFSSYIYLPSYYKRGEEHHWYLITKIW